MPVQYPSHLYIRVDRGLRQRLQETAVSNGLTVSALARRELSAALKPHGERTGVVRTSLPNPNATPAQPREH